MILIDDILISDDILKEYFLCNLSACKGACCWEGDWGAPLEPEEVEVLDDILEELKPYLPEKSLKLLELGGPTAYYEELGKEGTNLHEDGACVFLTYDELGIARCGIEQAFRDGKINFRKPISCHLYPIRVSKNEIVGFEAMNYDRWEICNAACSLGEKEKVPLYKFAREAIIRAYGQSFYDQLEAAAVHMDHRKS
jgi:Fe-S-cluster containining protein